MQDLFDCKLNVIHAEIAVRLGDVSLAHNKVGEFIQLYVRVPGPAKRMITNLLGVSINIVEINNYKLTPIDI